MEGTLTHTDTNTIGRRTHIFLLKGGGHTPSHTHTNRIEGRTHTASKGHSEPPKYVGIRVYEYERWRMKVPLSLHRKGRALSPSHILSYWHIEWRGALSLPGRGRIHSRTFTHALFLTGWGVHTLTYSHIRIIGALFLSNGGRHDHSHSRNF